MSPHGILMRLLIGENHPEPAPREVMEAFLSAEVATSDEEPTRFQLTFGVGRSGASDLADYELLRNSKLNPFNRLILAITFGSREEVLVDGFITDQQLNPGNEPGTSTMSITGEDVQRDDERAPAGLQLPGQAIVQRDRQGGSGPLRRTLP